MLGGAIANDVGLCLGDCRLLSFVVGELESEDIQASDSYGLVVFVVVTIAIVWLRLLLTMKQTAQLAMKTNYFSLYLYCTHKRHEGSSSTTMT
jgi:hypothetical protein